MKAADDLLYDSEASLRLVDHAIKELSASGTELDPESRDFLQHVMSQPGGFSQLAKSLLRAYAETLGIVARMHSEPSGREQGETDRLSLLSDNLGEVNSATEEATTDILDGLGRAISVVERLDQEGAEASRRRDLVALLRDELYGVVAHLQFQDITAQQLDQVSSLLVDTRRSLLDMLTVFTPSAVLTLDQERSAAPESRASMLTTAEREAVVKETLARKSARKTA